MSTANSLHGHSAALESWSKGPGVKKRADEFLPGARREDKGREGHLKDGQIQMDSRVF